MAAIDKLVCERTLSKLFHGTTRKLMRELSCSCRVRGQEDDLAQLFVEDVTGHSFLNTKTDNVIDLAQNPTYVILDLGCTESMGSRYAVTKFMKAAHVHGLDFEIVPSSSKF